MSAPDQFNRTTADDPMRMLDALSEVPGGPHSYYKALLRHDDEHAHVAAWCQLLDSGATNFDWNELVAASRYGAVRLRAFDFFESKFEYALAAKVAEQAGMPPESIRADAFAARLSVDHAAAARVQGNYFLDTGEIGHLVNAAREAELGGGWRAALAWSVRAVAAAPMVADLVGTLYLLLAESRQADLIEQLAARLRVVGLHEDLNSVFLAAAALIRGDAAACLDGLAPFDAKRVDATPSLRPLKTRLLGMQAEALHELGRYRDAHNVRVQIHALDRSPQLQPAEYISAVARRGRMAVPNLPPDTRHDVVSMLGFPRSGTTLLENILAAHPLVETFEEIPSLKSAITHVMRALETSSAPSSDVSAFEKGRAAYYREIDIRRRKSQASVLVDKLPLQSAEAPFLKRMFPERRYIFSIRHPYDVILSCYRQRFSPNEAMESFRSIDTAVRLYDFAMTQWFSQFSKTSPEVCYVRYDDLVSDFDRTARSVLAFLGLEWEDSVRKFAETAAQRSARTPSYQKVRQGLSIGVQTAWRHYAFLFETVETAPLQKWAEFFGYDTA